ncbi:hypothetical protein ACS0TY_002866 [Phlomoides rotata]
MSPPAPAPASVDQTETRSSSVMEFGTTIMALANRAVDAISRSHANSSLHSEAFQDCLNSHEFDDMGKCQYYVDMLADCCKKKSTC